MNVDQIKMIPFTDEEITEVQVTIIDRILELNRDIKDGKVAEAAADTEMATLTRVSDKVAKYSPRRR